MMKDFEWSEIFKNDIENEGYWTASNLSVHYDNKNKPYLTINNMIISKFLRYNELKNKFNNNYDSINKQLNNYNYFNDSNIFDSGSNNFHSGNSHQNDGWGGFKITGIDDEDDLYLPFENTVMDVNKVYKKTFKFLNESWVLNYGWNNNIFIFGIYQKTGKPKLFKLKFDGRYSVNSYPSSDYSENKNYKRIINNDMTIYSHYHCFNEDKNTSIKMNYSLVPFETKKINNVPFSSEYYSTKYRFYSYSSGEYYNDYLNDEFVESIPMKYGFTMYLSWGRNLKGRDIKSDFQDYIVNDLDYGANFKMCDFENDIPMKDIIGYRETNPIKISDPIVCNDTFIKYDAIIPKDSYIKLESNVSFDNGIDWTGWQEITGNKIPQLKNGFNISNAYIKIREVLFAPNENNVPKLYDVNFKIIAPKLKYLIADGDNIKTYIREKDWVKSPYNIVGYMESNTYPTPYECTASSIFTESFQPYNAFNHTNDTQQDCWASENGLTNGWLKYDFGPKNEKKLYKYRITSRNNNDTDSAPKKWILEGSKDNFKWDILDSQDNQIEWKRNETREYEINCNEFYRFFRLSISENNGNGSTLTVGQIELFSLEYKVVKEYWKDLNIKINNISKKVFEENGFEDIENFDCDKLSSLNEVKILMSMDNLYYIPHVNYRGFKKVPSRNMVKIQDDKNKIIIKPWSDYSLDKRDEVVLIPNGLLSAKSNKKVTVVSQTSKNDITEKSFSIKIKNKKPVIEGGVKNNILTFKIDDDDKDLIRYNIKVNNKKVFPSSGDISQWIKSPLNFKYKINTKDLHLNIINTLEVYAEDIYGYDNKLLLTFTGNYSNIIFKNEDDEIYSDDFGKVLKNLDFGKIESGDISDVKKIIFKNKNGYDVENIRIYGENKYDDARLEFSFSNNPFKPVSELNFQRKFSPDAEGIFYVRIKSDLSDKIELKDIKTFITAEPI